MELWNDTPPLVQRARWHYPIVWDAGEFGEISFRVTVSPCNEELGLFFNDWIPGDPASWRAWAAWRESSAAQASDSDAPG